MRLTVTATRGTTPDGDERPLWIVEIDPEGWERTAYPAAGVARELCSWVSADDAERVAREHVRGRLRALADALAEWRADAGPGATGWPPTRRGS